MKINRLNQPISAPFVFGAASLVLGIVFAMPVQADVAQWTGANSGDWTDSGNWQLAAPVAGSDVILTDLVSSSNNNVNYSNSGNTSPGGSTSSAFNSVLVDGSLNAMTLNQGSDSLNAGILTVGEAGKGIYNMTGGSLNVTNSVEDGNYNLQSLVVGDVGVGEFNHTNSTATSSVSAQEMTLGNLYGASGSYTLTDSGIGALSLNVIDKEVIGENGAGTFTQNGGSNLASTLIVGDGTGQVANSYNLNSGALIVSGSTSIGNAMGEASNTANFTQTGGTATTGAFSMANGCTAPDIGGGCTPGSAAYAAISGGNFNVTGVATIGAGGYAQFTESGATTKSTISNLIVGAAASSLFNANSSAALGLTSQGVIDLSGGDLHVTYNAVIGAGDSTSNGPAISGTLYGTNGIVNQVGGNFLIDGGLTVGQAGSIVGGQGVYNLSGGLLAVTGNIVVGESSSVVGGAGVFTESNGTLTAGNMTVGTGGTFNYSGGSFTLNSGTGALVNDGQVTINGGGSLTINAIVINGVDGNFNVSGTTVTYTGNFTNNGAYSSDPSTNVFNGLTVGTNGYLIGSSGDVFKMQGDFYNNSTSGLWATSAAMLEFTASPATHQMTTMGTAFGQYDWGTLQIDSGARLNLMGTMTVGWLDLMDGINQLTGNFTIYYDATLSGYLGVSDYLVGDGGNLIAYNIPNSDPSNVPEPATWTLLVLSLLALLLHRRYSSI